MDVDVARASEETPHESRVQGRSRVTSGTVGDVNMQGSWWCSQGNVVSTDPTRMGSHGLQIAVISEEGGP